MKNKQNPGANFSILRRKAEKKLKTDNRNQPDSPPSYHEMQHVLHELEVHKIELEMQQEELLQSRAETEEGLKRYIELYDFAPLGYLTLSRNGTIIEVNLAASKILGLERSLLTGDRFGRFIRDEDLPAFNALLERIFSRTDPWFCEVQLHNDAFSEQMQEGLSTEEQRKRIAKTIRIEAILSNDGEACRIVLSDITGHREHEKNGAEIHAEKIESIKGVHNACADEFDHQLLDKVIHSRIRLAALSYLNTVRRSGFVEIRDKIKATDGNLSIHMRLLESAGYICCDKEFLARKPQTIYSITEKGRDAFNRYTGIVSELINSGKLDS
ncbi:MAG: PAS domain S-box protein [Chlorobiaceae bacterium]|jgi:PAS domain-containing protein|nr:PAS domain S-box protein [Chlorobiaceae bacterium]